MSRVQCGMQSLIRAAQEFGTGTRSSCYLHHEAFFPLSGLAKT